MAMPYLSESRLRTRLHRALWWAFRCLMCWTWLIGDVDFDGFCQRMLGKRFTEAVFEEPCEITDSFGDDFSVAKVQDYAVEPYAYSWPEVDLEFEIL